MPRHGNPKGEVLKVRLRVTQALRYREGAREIGKAKGPPATALRPPDPRGKPLAAPTDDLGRPKPPSAPGR